MATAVDNSEQVEIGKASFFSWDIESIRLIYKNVGEVLSSPEFFADNNKWQLKIYPNGFSQSHEGYVSIALQLQCDLNQEDQKDFILAISFVNYCNKVLFSCMECVTFSAEHTSWQLDRLTEYDEFLSKLNHVAPDNKIKIKCELLHNTNTTSNACTALNFENFFNSEAHSDVKLSVKGKLVYGHKIILSSKSKVYAAMFEHSMRENLDNVVYVEDIEYEVFIEMLRFMYTGRVKNMKNVVKSLLIAADKYAVDDLKFVCGQCLCASLSTDNVVEYLEFADTFNVKVLRSNAIDFILSNANTLVDVPSFKSVVELRGDLVFEVIRCLAKDQGKTDGVASNSKESLSLAGTGLEVSTQIQPSINGMKYRAKKFHHFLTISWPFFKSVGLFIFKKIAAKTAEGKGPFAIREN